MTSVFVGIAALWLTWCLMGQYGKIGRPRKGTGHTERVRVGKQIGIRNVPDELRIRFKIAAAQEDKTYADFLDQLLDEHESRKRRRLRAMRSPLHQPTEED